MIGGYQIRMLAPVELEIGRYDILRRLGLRRPKVCQLIDRGRMLVRPAIKTIFVRPDEYYKVTRMRFPLSVDTVPLAVDALDEVDRFLVRTEQQPIAELRDVLNNYPSATQ